jgi:hypothetical protein
MRRQRRPRNRFSRPQNSTVGYYISNDATIILLSPPPAISSSLSGKGGGLDSDFTRMQEEDGLFPPSHPPPPSFPSPPSPPLLSGHLRR